MIEGRTNPLEIASRVLKPETLREVRTLAWPHPNSAYSILDRWALNNPDMLKALEANMGGFELLLRLDQQVNLEARTLFSDTAWMMRQSGMSDFEILSELGIETELTSINLD